MSNGVAKPGGEEFEVVEETDIVEIPDNDILSSTVDGDKEVDQNILYPDDIEYILAKLNYLCEKSEVLIHRLQILKYSQNANDGGHDAGGVIEILREMQTIQKSLEEYIQAREIRGPMGQFINLNQEIRILILEGGISEGEVSFLVNAIEGLKDYFELEREKSLENAAEQGLYFSRSFNELVQKIQGVRADIWRNGVDLVDGNSALISYVKEAQKMTQALKKNDKLSSYVKSNVLNPIIDIIDSLVRSDQPALDLADTGIGTFQKKINQLINFFEQEIEKKKREVEGVSSRSESLIIGPAPPIPIEERMDPAENQRSIAQIRSLIKEGKKREAMPLIETVCNSFQVYQRLWDEGNQDKRSFMEEKDSMHPLVENFLIDFFSSEAMRAEHANTRVLELGPGIGNDALNWLKYMPNLKQYLGLEASERAANIARARIKSLLVAREPGDIAPGWSIEVGDFVKRIQGVAQGMEQMGGRMSDVTTVITSISTLHYFWQPVFREILRSIHEILFHSRGYLVMALKTPDSASFKEHDLVESSRGYKVGIHKTEGILRAFMTPEEINKMLNEKGYEVIIAFPKVVEGYDRPGDREVFWCVIAKPKKITRKA